MLGAIAGTDRDKICECIRFGKYMNFVANEMKTGAISNRSYAVLNVRDITKLRGYPRSNVKTRLEQSNLFLASGRFPIQNAIYLISDWVAKTALSTIIERARKRMQHT